MRILLDIVHSWLAVKNKISYFKNEKGLKAMRYGD